MSDEWDFQLRVVIDDAFTELARGRPDDPALKPLADVLAKHDAKLKCQYDAFADYVAEAEKHGVDQYPLYKWTKATIEDPAKKAKYLKAFTLYVGGDEVYARTKAEPLEADLQPLVGGGIVAKLAKHDTNPANNPQAPAKYRN